MMSNPNKAKGTAWESSVRDYLNKRLGQVDEYGKFISPFSGLNVRRPAQEGARDVGDVHAVPFVLECKDVARPTIPAFLRQAETEAANASFPFGVAVVKSRGQNVSRGRVYFSVLTWTAVRHALGMDTDTMRGLYGFKATIRGVKTSRWYLSCSLDAFAALLEDVRAMR